MFEILQSLAVGQSHSREPFHLLTDGEICPLYVRGRYVPRIGSAVHDFWDRSDNLVRVPVPFRASNIAAPVELQKHGVIDLRPKVLIDNGRVPAQRIRRQLESPGHALAKVTDKSVGAGSVASANVETENHFGFAVDAVPEPLVAPFGGSVGPESALVASDIAPHLSAWTSRVEIFRM